MTEQWRDKVNERQWQEIEFCRIYTEHFNHGTDGHNFRQLISLLAELLDDQEKQIEEMKRGIDAR